MLKRSLRKNGICGSEAGNEYIVDEDECLEGLVELPLLERTESVKDIKLGEDLSLEENRQLVQMLKM